MDDHSRLIAIPPLALAVNIVVQLAMFRARDRRDPWGSILYGFAAGLAVAVLGSIVSSRSWPAAEAIALSLMNIVSFAALAYGYFTFVNLNFTSLRVRLLRELSGRTNPVTRQELLGTYDAQAALALRIERLTAKGQLAVRNGRYYVRGVNSFLIIGYLLDALKWLILGRPFSRRAVVS